jgi:prepilin-type N-terminal cleavage/methylation domain-containing protein
VGDLKRDTGFTLIELLIVVAIIGIIAAIAIPSLLRARVSANEAATIADIRTLISAQAAYHAANLGLYSATLVCLGQPSGAGCIPGYPAAGPVFIDSGLAAGIPKSGYVRSFQAVAAANPPGGSGVNSTHAYAYLATPMASGQTGVRGMGGDASGQICTTPDATAPAANAGVITRTTCTILQ